MLTDEHRGVIRNVSLIVIACTAALTWGASLLPLTVLPADEAGARLAWAVQWALLPAACLFVMIFRMAMHRFYTPEDTPGSGLSVATPEARIRQAVLQNTLEQTVLAVIVYCAWATVMPYAWLRTIAVAAILFVAGRIVFTIGYPRGGPGRAPGFALTSYPTGLMLFSLFAVVGYELLI
jgi:hypothetical protein